MSQQVGASKKSDWPRCRREFNRRYGEPVRPFHVENKYATFKRDMDVLNSTVEEDSKQRVHQRILDIREYVIPDHVFQPRSDRVRSANYSTNYERNTTMVTTRMELVNMTLHLDRFTEFAVDLEGTVAKGYRGSQPALIQFSNAHYDFLVDTFQVWGDLKLLRQIMQDPKVAKIMFGADNDIKWFQQYFKIDPFPVIDVQTVYQTVTGEKNKIGLETFVRKFLPKAEINKKFQYFDWAYRPLPLQAIKYATDDTRLLLQAWNNYKIELRPVVEQQAVALHSAVIAQNIKVAVPFKSIASPKPSDMNQIRNLNLSRDLFKAIYAWRDTYARKYDIYPEDLLSVKEMILAANAFERFRTFKGLDRESKPYLRASDVHELQVLLSSARQYRQVPIVPKPIVSVEQEIIESDVLQINVDENQLADLLEVTEANSQCADEASEPDARVEPMEIDNGYVQKSNTVHNVSNQWLSEPMDVTEDQNQSSTITEVQTVTPKVIFVAEELSDIESEEEYESMFTVKKDSPMGKIDEPIEYKDKIFTNSKELEKIEAQKRGISERIVVHKNVRNGNRLVKISQASHAIQRASQPHHQESDRHCFKCWKLDHVRNKCPWRGLQLTDEMKNEREERRSAHRKNPNNKRFHDKEAERKRTSTVRRYITKGLVDHQLVQSHLSQQLKEQEGVHGGVLGRVM
ncbi:unnamed protein product [Orchesella dallaii]|uniref:3'-5' exonuclease domain-containing protein n=1 Tax=Orchesella dallaii TaxID=48710 RepID=A0ABP1QM83_9HEXA